MLPLRVFLGVTFVYAGVQKLSDPGFLHPGAPTYIGTQLRGFAHGTPGGFLLRTFAIPHAELAGVVVAIVEIAVGLLVLAGLLTRLAAAVGLSLNLVLFLTASWHTSPYFLGSDIVFVFAWLPFVLAGAKGQPAVDHVLSRWGREGPPWRTRARIGLAAPVPALTRRAVLLEALGLAGLATMFIGGLSALAKGSYRVGGTRALLSKHGTPSATSHRTRLRSTAGRVPSGAVAIGPSSGVPRSQAATYTDPADGEPDILIRDRSGKLHAFNAVCTHAGCTVGYQSGQIVCPCHGGAYDPATGAVVSGPPPAPLAQRRVLESGGRIYAVPS